MQTTPRRDESLSAVGLDLDGTLFDHHGSATAAVKDFILHFDREPTPELVAAWFDIEAQHFESWRTGQLTFADQRRLRLRDFLGALSVREPDDVETADAMFGRYLASYRRSWRAFDDAAPFLHQLRSQGTRVGVLTNGNYEQQVDKLHMTGLAPLVDIVCVSEHYAPPVANSSPQWS